MDANDEPASGTQSSAKSDVEKEHESDVEVDEHKDRARAKSQRGEAIRAWIPVIVGASGVLLTIIGLAWGAWSFYFKEVIEPKSAPVNVSIDLGIQAAGIEKDVDHNTLSAATINITATNPSTRGIYIIPSIYQVFGDKIVTPTEDLVKSLRSIIDNETESNKEEYVKPNPELIAAGRPFDASILQPKETIKRSFLIHFPQNKYDMLEVNLLLPTVAVPGKVKTIWELSSDSVISIKFYRIDSGKEINRDPDGRYDESIGLQLKLTRAELSLWH